MDLQKVQAIAEQLKEQVHKAVVGQDEALDLLLKGIGEQIVDQLELP